MAANVLRFLREHGLIGSLFRLVGLVWRLLFRTVVIGAIFRLLWAVLFGAPRKGASSNDDPSEEDAPSRRR